MKVLILAAGYGKRLYPLTKYIAKPLLIVKGLPIIEHLVLKVNNIRGVKEILIVTNDKFYESFRKWKSDSGFSKVAIFNDGTKSPGNRLGAVGDIQYAIKHKKINDDLLILGGDNFFGFNLLDFIIFGQTKSPFCSIGVYNIHNKLKAKRFGTLKLNRDNRVIDFKEKSRKPDTTFVSPCIYYFTKTRLNLVGQYLREKNNPDMSGHFIDWLYQRDWVYGFVFHGRWTDIGNLASYKLANRTI